MSKRVSRYGFQVSREHIENRLKQDVQTARKYRAEDQPRMVNKVHEIINELLDDWEETQR